MLATMAALRLTNFRLEEQLLDALQTIKDRDGVPISVQVRRAIEAWIQSKGVRVKAAPRRALTRRKA
jgi:hypothetical protein